VNYLREEARKQCLVIMGLFLIVTLAMFITYMNGEEKEADAGLL